MRHSVGDRRQQSKAPPLCANHTCILTYILRELILNDPNLLFSLHLPVVPLDSRNLWLLSVGYTMANACDTPTTTQGPYL